MKSCILRGINAARLVTKERERDNMNFVIGILCKTAEKKTLTSDENKQFGAAR